MTGTAGKGAHLGRERGDEREQLADAIYAAGDALDGLRTAIAVLRDRADQLGGAGLLSLNLERALISIAAADRELERARREAER